jgi:hypothetical protein
MASEDEVRVGITVQFRYGSQKVIGTVKEDRGSIGRGGRRLYLITFESEPKCLSNIELPADQLEVQHLSLL